MDCDSDNPARESRSRWGGVYHICTIITDRYKQVVFPSHTKVSGSGCFVVKGYDAKNSDFLTYINLGEPILLEENTELKVWFGEDLMDTSEHDNSGKHCVDVYAKISDQF